MVDAIEWHGMMFRLLKYEFFGVLNWKHALVNNVNNGIAVKRLQLRKHAYARKSYLLSKVHLLMYQHINIIIAVYFSFNEEKYIITHDKKEGLTGVLANGLI